MTAHPIRVIAYAGYRGDEAPRRFLRGGRMVAVASVEAAWIEETLPSGERRRCFTIRDVHGRAHRIYCAEATALWYAAL